MENFKFRKLNKDDLYDAMILVKEVFDEFEAPFYSKQGIDSFYKFIDLKNIENKFKTNEILLYGAFLDDKIIGVLGLRNPNHICLLFISNNYHKKRISKQVI